jgi:hypothetical protein
MREESTATKMSRRRSRTCKIIDNPKAPREDLEWLKHRNRRAALTHPNVPPDLIRTSEDAKLASLGPAWKLLILENPRLKQLLKKKRIS